MNKSSISDVILVLDLGTTTGWAMRTMDNTITSGTLNFKSNRFEGGGMRFLKFKQWLNSVQELVGTIDVIYYEEVRRHIGTDAAHTYGAFWGHLTAWCENRSVPYEGVPVGTIKKHITGKGNSNKQAVIDAVRKLGYLPRDDNEADALALLQWVLSSRIGGEL